MIITIVGLGETWRKMVPGDETWAINGAGLRVSHDMIFHMDDCRVQEARARAGNNSIKTLLEVLEVHPSVMTSTVYPEYPGARAFPLKEVCSAFKTRYFNSTSSYAIAYAIYRGAEEIRLYGIDFSYPNAHKVEKGRACVEYWIGRAVERGVKVTLPEETTLMDMNCQGLYGYDAHHVLNDFSMIPKDIPSAAEMETRYG